MDPYELNSLTLERAQTVTLPAPEPLIDAVDEDPEQFGLPEGLSRRQALGRLLLRGARDAVFEQRERARAAMYERLRSDPEWREAARESYAEAREDDLF